jgi:hypothetical protein
MVMKTLIWSIFIGISYLLGSSTKAEFKSFGDYISISREGEISILSGAKNTSQPYAETTKKVALNQAEYVVSQPYFYMAQDLKKYLFFFTVESSLKKLNVFELDDSQASFSLKEITRGVDVGQGPHSVAGKFLFILNSQGPNSNLVSLSLEKIVLGNNISNSVTAYNPDIESIEFITVTNKSGEKFLNFFAASAKVTRFKVNDDVLSDKSELCSRIAGNSAFVKPISFVQNNVPLLKEFFVTVSNKGHLYTCETSVLQTWSESIEDFKVNILPKELSISNSDAGIVQVLNQNNDVVEIDIMNSNVVSHQKTFLLNASLVRDIEGNPVGEGVSEYSSYPSAFAQIGSLGVNSHENILWGYFHHNSAFSLSQFKVSPEIFSPVALIADGKAGAAVISFPADGTQDIIFHLSLLQKNGNKVRDISNPRSRLVFGQNTFLWNGSLSDSDPIQYLSSNRYDIELKLFSADASVTLASKKIEIVYDIDPVISLSDISYSLKLENGLSMRDDGEYLLAAPFHQIEIDFTKLKDQVPFEDEQIDIEIILQDKDDPNKKFTYYHTQKNDPVVVNLDGKDFSQAELPDGYYNVFIQLKDHAGNKSAVIDEFTINGKSYDGIYTNRNSLGLNLWVTPGIVTNKDNYSIDAFLTLIGENGTYSIKYELINTSGTVHFLEENTGINIPNGKIEINKNFNIEQISETGKNIIQVTVSNTSGNTQSISFPIIRDVFETVISSPKIKSDGSYEKIYDKLVKIKGVAVAPTFKSNQNYYKAFYIEGSLSLVSGVTDISELFVGVDWKPLTVPISQQMRKTHELYNLAKGNVYSEYPNSNISTVSLSGNGTLAEFQPSDYTGPSDYTVLVVSYEINNSALDSDEDGIIDSEDNCVYLPNIFQLDENNDNVGDDCQIEVLQYSDLSSPPISEMKLDSDGDGKSDDMDLCPFLDPGNTNSTIGHTDNNNNLIGDQCESNGFIDSDGDGVEDNIDNCKYLINPNQIDSNNDNIGDFCQKSKKSFSYDFTTFHYAPPFFENPTLFVTLNNSQKNIEAINNLTLVVGGQNVVEPEFNKFDISVSAGSAKGDVNFVVVEGSLQEVSNNSTGSFREVRRSSVFYNGADEAEFLFDGTDWTSNTIDEGVYTLIIDFNSAQEGKTRKYIPFHVSVPDPTLNNDQLIATPNRFLFDEALGIQPEVKLLASVGKKTNFNVEIFHTSSLDPLKSFSFTDTKSEEFYWDFIDETDNVSYLDKLDFINDEIQFEAVLSVGGTIIARRDFYVETNFNFIDSPQEILEQHTGGVWAPELESGYKFKALAQGPLSYYPNRSIRPGFELKGDQVVRRYRDVLYGIDYAKYYNTLSVFAEYRVRLKGYHSGYWESGTWWTGEYLGENPSMIYAEQADPSSPRLGAEFSQDHSVIKSSNTRMFYGPVKPWFDQAEYVKSNTNPNVPAENLDVFRRLGQSRFYEDQEDNFKRERELYKNDVLFAQRMKGKDESGDDKLVHRGQFDLGVSFAMWRFGVGGDGNQKDLKGAKDISNIISGNYLNGPKNSEEFAYRKRVWKNNYGSSGSQSYGLFWQYRYGISNRWSQNLSRWDYDTGDAPRNVVFLGLGFVQDQYEWTSSPVLLQTGANNPFVKKLNRQHFEQKLQEINSGVEPEYVRFVDEMPWNTALMRNGTNQVDGVLREDCENYTDDTGNNYPQDYKLDCSRSTDKELSPNGMKIGLRGFAYTENLNNCFEVTNSVYPNKATLCPKDYVENYFQNEDNSQIPAHVRWKYGQFDQLNQDQLVFYPVLKVSPETENLVWDEKKVEFPFMNTSQGKEVIGSPNGVELVAEIERDANKNIIAFTQLQLPNFYAANTIAGNNVNFTINQANQLGGTYLDHKCLNISEINNSVNAPIFEEILAKTNKTNGYPYLDDQSLVVDPKSHISTYTNFRGVVEPVYKNELALYMQDEVGRFDGTNIVKEDGTFITNCDATIQMSKGDFIYKVSYLNKPMEDGYWSSGDDVLFDRYNGYLYGSGVFNDNSFKDQNRGLEEPSQSSQGGYVGLVKELFNNVNLNVPTQTLSSGSPFVLNAQNQVAFNSNLILDKLKWNFDVYYHDGELLNNALRVPNNGVESQNSDNFNLRLNLDVTPKNFVEIRGVISPAITLSDGTDLSFKEYKMYAVLETNGRKRLENIAVNKFYRSDQNNRFKADILPTLDKDLWNETRQDIFNPILSYWDVTHLNGEYEILLLVDYKDSNNDVYTVKETKKIQIGTGLGVITETQQIESPYKRASLQMPEGTFAEGDVISMYPMAYSDLNLGDNKPDIQPVGPVIEVKTTNPIKKFNGANQPVIGYKYSGREIYELECLNANVHVECPTDFSNNNKDQIFTLINAVIPTYKVFMLSAENDLDAMNTIASIPEESEISDVANIIVTLTANVTHFSWALVLRGQTPGAGLPVITHTIAQENNVLVKGLYGSPIGANIPSDLEIYVHNYASKLDNPTTLKGPFFATVNAEGGYEVLIPKNQFYIGQNFIFANYTGSVNAAKTNYIVEGNAFNINSLDVSPKLIQPLCLSNQQTIGFASDKSGSVLHKVVDAQGITVLAQTIEVKTGYNQIFWDGCSERISLLDGVYEHQILADGVLSQQKFVVGSSSSEKLINQISLEYLDYYPSITMTNNQVLYINTLNVNDVADISIEISYNGAPVRTWNSFSIEQVSTEGNETLYKAEWSGIENNSYLPSGEYSVAVNIPSSNVASTENVNFTLKIGNEPTIQINLSESPIFLPISGVRAELITDKKLKGSLYLQLPDESIYGYLLGSELKPVMIYNGSSFYSIPEFQVTDNLPSTLVFEWEDEYGYKGKMTRELNYTFFNPDLTSGDVSFFPTDEIHPEITDDLLSNFDPNNLPNSKLIINVESPTVADAKINITKNGVEVYSFEHSLNVGANVLEWAGINQAGEVLSEEGEYLVSIYAKSPVSDQNDVLLNSQSIQVKLFPEVVICASNEANFSITPGISNSLSIASGVEEFLRGKDIEGIRIMNPIETQAYMNYKKDGLVVFTTDLVPNNMYLGSFDNPVVDYIRNGGRVAFFNRFPLANYFDGTQKRDYRLALRLFGFSEFGFQDFLNETAESIFVDESAIPASLQRPADVDISHINDLTLLLTDHDTQKSFRTDIPLKSMGIKESYLVENRGQFNAITWKEIGSGTDVEKIVQSGYFKPNYAPFTSLNESGSFLVFEPYGLNTSGAYENIAVNNYGSSIYRHFFANDLSIIEPNIIFAVDKDNIIRPRGGNTISIPVKIVFGYSGDKNSRLDQVVLNLFSQSKDGTKTLLATKTVGSTSTPIDKFSTELERTVDYTFILDETSAFEEHEFIVEIEPFSFIPEGETQAIVEDILYNNIASLQYRVVSDYTPIITINTDDYLSDLLGAFDYNIRGLLKTEHSVGDFTLDLELFNKITNEVVFDFNDNISASGQTGSPYNTVVKPFISLSQNDNYAVRARVEDKYGNTSVLSKDIQIDVLKPNVTKFEIQSPINSELKDPNKPTSDINIDEYFVAGDKVEFDLEATDNIGLKEIQVYLEGVLLETIGSISGTSVNQRVEITAKQGLYEVRFVDVAGNYVTESFMLEKDELPPFFGLFVVTKTFTDDFIANPSLLDIDFTAAKAEDRNTYYLEDEPILHQTTVVDRSSNETTSESINQKRIYFETQYSEKLPGMKKGDYTTKYVPSSSKIRFVIDFYEQNLKDVEVTLVGPNGVRSNIDIYSAAANPYISQLRNMHIDAKEAFVNHKYQRYFEIDNLVLGDLYTLEVKLLDLGNNETTVSVKLGEPNQDLAYKDPKDNVQSGADFGEVYIRKDIDPNGLAAGSWVYFMIQNYNANYALAQDTLYFDENASGLNDELPKVSSLNLTGFKYRVVFTAIDTLDTELNTHAKFQKWDGSAWVDEGSVVGGVASAKFLFDVNQVNSPWTSSFGEGSQVTPSDSLAVANGGLWEFGFKIDENLPDLSSIRWFISSGNDMVYDLNTNRPFVFVFEESKNVSVDAQSEDWYGEVYPPRYNLSSVKAKAQAVAVGNDVMKVSFSMENTGMTDYSGLTLRYLVDLSACSDVSGQVMEANANNWELAKFIPANKMPHFISKSDGVYLAEIVFDEYQFTAGSVLYNVPVLNIKANNCSTKFQSEIVNQSKHTEILNENADLLWISEGK